MPKLGQFFETAFGIISEYSERFLKHLPPNVFDGVVEILSQSF